MSTPPWNKLWQVNDLWSTKITVKPDRESSHICIIRQFKQRNVNVTSNSNGDHLWILPAYVWLDKRVKTGRLAFGSYATLTFETEVQDLRSVLKLSITCHWVGESNLQILDEDLPDQPHQVCRSSRVVVCCVCVRVVGLCGMFVHVCVCVWSMCIYMFVYV